MLNWAIQILSLIHNNKKKHLKYSVLLLHAKKQPEICRQNMKFQFQVVVLLYLFFLHKNNKLIKKEAWSRRIVTRNAHRFYCVLSQDLKVKKFDLKDAMICGSGELWLLLQKKVFKCHIILNLLFWKQTFASSTFGWNLFHSMRWRRQINIEKASIADKIKW